MFRNKKITASGRTDENPLIDFHWLFYVAMNKLGFNYVEAGHLYFGMWSDMFATHKQMHNFEMKKGLYDTTLSEPVSSLDVL